jgi:hypothetical protein
MRRGVHSASAYSQDTNIATQDKAATAPIATIARGTHASRRAAAIAFFLRASALLISTLILFMPACCGKSQRNDARR